jgi:hypothetical protein
VRSGLNLVTLAVVLAAVYVAYELVKRLNAQTLQRQQELDDALKAIQNPPLLNKPGPQKETARPISGAPSPD